MTENTTMVPAVVIVLSPCDCYAGHHHQRAQEDWRALTIFLALRDILTVWWRASRPLLTCVPESAVSEDLHRTEGVWNERITHNGL